MNTYELSRDQMGELKECYLCETRENVSCSDITFADRIVSDQTIHEHYAGTDFVDDDFFCSGQHY